MTKKPALWTKQFGLITLINLLIFFGFQILTPILPVYIKSLGAADETIGWVTGIFTISALIIRPFIGQGLDALGHRPIFLAGLVVFMAVTAAYSWLPSVGLILLFRFLHGFGWGAVSTGSNTIASHTIPKQRLGEGMGFFTLSSNLAMALAPAVGLSIILKYSFSTASFLAAGLIGLSLVLALFVNYRPARELDGYRPRAAFFEITALRPAGIIFFVTVTYGAINSFLAIYGLERGIEQVGLYFSVMALAMVLSRPGFGWLVDRKGFSIAVIPGLLLVIASMIVLSLAETSGLFLTSALLFGIGFGATQTSLQTMAVIAAPADRLGLANATFYTGFDSGIGLGSIVLGIIASKYGYSQMFLYSSLSVGLALVIYLWTDRKSSANNSGELI